MTELDLKSGSGLLQVAEHASTSLCIAIALIRLRLLGYMFMVVLLDRSVVLFLCLCVVRSFACSLVCLFVCFFICVCVCLLARSPACFRESVCWFVGASARSVVCRCM